MKTKDKEYMDIVIVGHVDHGKSTLIGRLFYDTNSLPPGKLKELKQASDALGKELEFGFILDHLEEEREQGITIDTTQKFFNTEKRNYTIIDAPGHVEFIKNMITGASQAQAAILIVDASEGVQEQTKRHAYILSMLGLKQVIVVINKMDLINYNKEKYEKVQQETQEFLKKINISPIYFIPISAQKGDNIAKKSEHLDWYSGLTTLEALDSFKKEKEKEKSLRFSVQDVYNFDKRIIAGKIISGTLEKNQEITILPSNYKTKIKTIEDFTNQVDKAIAGKNIGLTTLDKLFIERGNIIINSDSEIPKITDKIKANIFWLSQKPYKIGEKLTFKCSTQNIDCEIIKIKKKINSSTLEKITNNNKIENREAADVIIKTEKPVIIENFNKIPELGRFVLETNDTVAGGIIT